jgi:DNA invertase Pin-like site-specific DNA recombinase
VSAGKVVSYLRVSTARQGDSGLGIEAQRAAVLDYLNGGQWTLLREYVEIETGKRSDRPQLSAALAYARATGATVVIAKWDRLARNVAFTAALLESGVDFVACDNPHATRFTIHILASVAEYEAQAISQRTRAALQAAKARGTVLGNPNGAAALQRAARAAGRTINASGVAGTVAAAIRHMTRVLPVIEAIQAEGITTLQGIAAELNARGILTARGGRWYATTVRNLLARGSRGLVALKAA